MKHAQRLCSIFLALTLCFSLAAVAVSAEGGYDILVKNEEEGHVYEAYQIFTGTRVLATVENVTPSVGENIAEDDTTSSDNPFPKPLPSPAKEWYLVDIEWGSGLTEEGKRALSDWYFENYDADNDERPDIYPAYDVAKAIESRYGYAGDELAALLADYLAAPAATSSEPDADMGGYLLTVEECGYYLVRDQKDALDGTNMSATLFLLRTLEAEGFTEIEPKTVADPELEKYVQYKDGEPVPYGWEKELDVYYGDEVYFALNATFPGNYDYVYEKVPSNLLKSLSPLEGDTEDDVEVKEWGGKEDGSSLSSGETEETEETEEADGEVNQFSGEEPGDAFDEDYIYAPLNFLRYEKYPFTFVDIIPRGVEIGDYLAVFTNGQFDQPIDPSYYTVTVTPRRDGTTLLRVHFDDLKTLPYVEANSYVHFHSLQVVFDATFTGYLMPSTMTTTVNNAHATYPNDPNYPEEEGGKTPTDSASLSTYSLFLTKTDAETGALLNGARFVLQNADGLYLTYDEAANDYDFTDLLEEAYVFETATGLNADVPAVEQDGICTIAGLRSGTYYLTEIEAPLGYNRLTESVTVEVLAAEEGVTAVNVENNKGLVLPSTGGIGTTVLYVVGAILLIGGGILVFAKRRTNAA